MSVKSLRGQWVNYIAYTLVTDCYGIDITIMAI